MLTSGLSEGTCFNPSSQILKNQLCFGNSKLLLSLKVFFQFLFSSSSVILWFNFHKCLYYSDWKCWVLGASKFYVRYLTAPYSLKENMNLKGALAGKCEFRKLFSVFF